jgi:hypothetical protein
MKIKVEFWNDLTPNPFHLIHRLGTFSSKEKEIGLSSFLERGAGTRGDKWNDGTME